jgi:small subunit ribosomal protein S6
MATEAPLYDLVLMLSVDAEDSTRSKILSDVEAAITGAGGVVERNDDWGRRPLAYEIRHQPEAEYHLLQFRAPGSLIEDLSHTLRITDGVVRHRVIKVRPGTPEAPSSIPVVAAVASAGAGAASAAAPASPAASAEPAAAPAES